jgi:hypothetical protein
MFPATTTSSPVRGMMAKSCTYSDRRSKGMVLGVNTSMVRRNSPVCLCLRGICDSTLHGMSDAQELASSRLSAVQRNFINVVAGSRE